MARDDCDILVHGAGMAGLATALLLAGAGLKVTIVARERPETWRGGDYRQRVIAVNRESEALLARLGAWPAIRETRACPVRAIEALDALGGGRVRFDAADLGEPHLAHIVENALVEGRLAERLRAAGVSLRTPNAVTGWSADPAGLDVRLESGRRLRTRLLIAADGADSPVRTLAGIRADDRHYGQRGLVAAVATEQPHRSVARQRFLAGGPLALLPLADGRCSVVWSLPEAEAKTMAGAAPEVLREALDIAADGWLGRIEAVSPATLFPLRRLHARRYVAERVVLVGDAAHVIHPLAGQGANLGFRDVAELAQRIETAAAAGRDPGGQGVLRRYERARRGDNLLMQTAMDLFHHGFTRSGPLLVAARSAGFDVTDRMAPLRRLFMRRAIGI